MANTASFIGLETEIIARLRATLAPEVNLVVGAAGIAAADRSIDTYVVYVINDGFRLDSRSTTSRSLVQSWRVVLVVNLNNTAISATAAQAGANAMLGRIDEALDLWRPQLTGAGPLKLTSGFRPEFAGRRLQYPLAYECQVCA